MRLCAVSLTRAAPSMVAHAVIDLVTQGAGSVSMGDRQPKPHLDHEPEQRGGNMQAHSLSTWRMQPSASPRLLEKLQVCAEGCTAFARRVELLQRGPVQCLRQRLLFQVGRQWHRDRENLTVERIPDDSTKAFGGQAAQALANSDGPDITPRFGQGMQGSPGKVRGKLKGHLPLHNQLHN